jgi:hypothetical protein
LNAFNEIESEMFQLSEHSDLIGHLGDINAKTGKLLGYVEADKSLLNIFDLQDDVDLINERLFLKIVTIPPDFFRHFFLCLAT